MSQHELDEAVAEIRGEQVSDESVKTAAKRVFGRLFDSAFVTPEPTGKIRGCADVRAMIPAYLHHSLSAARGLLLEDHILSCVACRHALQEARTGTSAQPVPINRPRRTPVPIYVWAAAATVAVGVGLGLAGLLPGQRAIDVEVASVQGTLYRVTDLTVSVVEAGAIIKNASELRTAKGSHAMLRLAGGVMAELAERSEVGIGGGGWHGTTLNVERGQVIVDAREGQARNVSITSGDISIPVTNSVMAINHGTKESRVAVAKGTVDVTMGAEHKTVNAGRQYGAHFRPVNLPIGTEFAWSQNAGDYTALLNELSGLQKDIQAIPSPAVRYQTQLAQYLPADTFLYAAVPNVGGTITEAKKLFDNRLAESEVLRQWWQQKDIAKNGQFDHLVDQVSSISSYLGDEIVISAGGDAAGQHAGPVFLAQIKQAGLADYLRNNLPADSHVQIITAGSTASGNNGLFVDLDNNVLVASPSAEQLKRVEDVVQKVAAGGFTGTPLYGRIGKIYDNGASYFLAADLEKTREQIAGKSVGNAKGGVPAGFNNVQYLVLERKAMNGDTEMKAAVSFAGARQGIASWLGAPSPAGSLDFVSPDAAFAASMIMKSPRDMMQELLGFAAGNDGDFTKELNEFETRAGVNLVNDVAAPLGTDVTMAMDSGLAPILAIEVNDPAHLQQTLQTFVQQFNQQVNQQVQEKMGKLILNSLQVNGRTFYSLSTEKAPGLAAYYTYVDGYLLASSSQANVLTAIQNKQTGHTLVESPAFQAKLPADGYANFSAMIYSNLNNSALGNLAKQVNPGNQPGGQQQQQMLGALLSKGGSGLVCVYGEPDRIVASTRGSFLGFDLGTLVGIEQGQSLKTIIAQAPSVTPKGIPN